MQGLPRSGVTQEAVCGEGLCDSYSADHLETQTPNLLPFKPGTLSLLPFKPGTLRLVFLLETRMAVLLHTPLIWEVRTELWFWHRKLLSYWPRTSSEEARKKNHFSSSLLLSPGL